MNPKSPKYKLRQLIHTKKFQFVLVFSVACLFALFFINPVYAQSPYQLPSDDVNEFAFYNMAIYENLVINCTIPEGDGFYNPLDNNSWQLVKVRYKVNADPVGIISDADLMGVSNQHIEEFSDEYWWEGIFDIDPIKNPFFIHPNISSNILFKEQYGNERYEYKTLSQDFNYLHFLGEKYSGYRYRATVMSPFQLGVLYCNSFGYTFHNVTSASTQYYTGWDGLRPTYMTELYGAPCEVDYNLSLVNPILELKPMNTSADLFTIGVNDFSSRETILFETFDGDDWINNDGFLGAIAVMVVAIVIIPVTAMITDCINNVVFTDTLKTLGSVYIATANDAHKAYNDGHNDGVDDATDTTLDLITNDPELRELLGNNSAEVYARLKALLNTANSIAKVNFTNPYPYYQTPSLLGNLFSPSEVNVIILIVVGSIVLVTIIIVVIVVIIKLRGKKKKKDGGGGQNITVFSSEKPKTNILDSITSLEFFGLSSGAI